MKKRLLAILSFLLILEISYIVGFYFYDLGINNNFIPYVSEYNTLYSDICSKVETRRGYLLSIQFTDETESDGTIGYCQFLLYKNRIRISKDFWLGASEREKRQLIWHELTHCYLYLDHSSDPRSYMFPFIHGISDSDLKFQAIKVLNDRCK